jgi:pimeloyl-ACP methyl ester carboxylesterase
MEAGRREFETVPFTAGDRFGLKLHRFKSATPFVHRTPVILVHGAGVRSNIFSPPNEDTLPRVLSREGYDVWTLDWRGSIESTPNPWTLDDAAVWDYPAAVAKVREISGADTVKAVIHCQGSTSFMMSAVAGLLPEVETVVSNAVALHTLVPPLSRVKSAVATDTIGRAIDYVNPQWGLQVSGFWPRAIDFWVRATHHECRNAVCKHSSFTYGSGFPTLWLHQNLSDETHEWLKGEFAHVPMTFFRQMKRCIAKGNLVSSGK